jgi:hypothetical protein
VKQGLIVLGCSQYAVGDGDQRAMPVDRVKVPALILIESISFARFVIDFNRPAVASDARHALGLPVQLVGPKEQSRIRKIRLAVIDDQAVLPNVMDTMRLAVTVIRFLIAFVGKRDLMNHLLMPLCKSIMVLWLQVMINGLS